MTRSKKIIIGMMTSYPSSLASELCITILAVPMDRAP